MKLKAMTREAAMTLLTELELFCDDKGKEYLTECGEYLVGKNKHGAYIVTHLPTLRQAREVEKKATTMQCAAWQEYGRLRGEACVGHGRTLKICKGVIAEHALAAELEPIVLKLEADVAARATALAMLT